MPMAVLGGKTMQITLKYEFEGNLFEMGVDVSIDDYVDYLFDQLLSAKRTDEARDAIAEMVSELDLYEIVEDYGFRDWLTEAHEEEAKARYSGIRGFYGRPKGE